MPSKPIFGFHRKDGESREAHDFYATHPSAVPPLLKILGWENGGKMIRENSCGQGHLCKPLLEYGHNVVASDLIDRGYGITGIDFLEPSWLDDLRYDAVIMNPPYSHALEFVEKSLKVAPVVCAFLRLAWLEGQKRKKFFENNPPSKVAVFSQRIPSAKNGDFENLSGGPVAYAWFIWDKSHQGPTILQWI